MTWEEEAIVAYATVTELLRHGRPIAFCVGILVGIAFSALLLTSADVEGSAVRAGGRSSGAKAGMPAYTSREVPSNPSREATTVIEVPARTTATEPASAPPRSMVAPLRDDPALVLAAQASPVPRSLVVAVGELHGIDGDLFADVMFCESSLRPDAIGDGGRAVGIAQWHALTWALSSRRYYGMELAPAMRFDPDLALLVAARKWAAEGPWPWTCARQMGY